MRPTVLVLCTGNSARSQMAEAIFRRRLGDRFAVHSAGTAPAERVHPLAVRAMEEKGYDLSGQRPKHLRELLGRVPVHAVLTVCGQADAECPSVWPGALVREHWPFEDPAATEGSEEARLDRFREVRDALEERVEDWIPSLRGRLPGGD